MVPSPGGHPQRDKHEKKHAHDAEHFHRAAARLHRITATMFELFSFSLY